MARPTLPVPHDVPYSDAELIVLRAMLEEQRRFRVEQLDQLRRPGSHAPLSSTDPEIVRSLAAGATAALRDVEAALGRMAAGSYGQCIECGEPIGRARLEIVPQTALCMSCQAQRVE